jgi:hypothetical protein
MSRGRREARIESSVHNSESCPATNFKIVLDKSYIYSRRYKSGAVAAIQNIIGITHKRLAAGERLRAADIPFMLTGSFARRGCRVFCDQIAANV